jgi:hypothetical protein
VYTNHAAKNDRSWRETGEQPMDKTNTSRAGLFDRLTPSFVGIFLFALAGSAHAYFITDADVVGTTNKIFTIEVTCDGECGTIWAQGSVGVPEAVGFSSNLSFYNGLVGDGTIDGPEISEVQSDYFFESTSGPGDQNVSFTTTAWLTILQIDGPNGAVIYLGNDGGTMSIDYGLDPTNIGLSHYAFLNTPGSYQGTYQEGSYGQPVPEPAPLLMFGLGFIGLVASQFKRPRHRDDEANRDVRTFA